MKFVGRNASEPLPDAAALISVESRYVVTCERKWIMKPQVYLVQLSTGVRIEFIPKHQDAWCAEMGMPQPHEESTEDRTP